MKIKQLPFVASALAMVGGLYLLAGPFQDDHSEAVTLLPLWGLLQLYEVAVLGMIAVLHRREIETLALRIISILFLADPIFFGHAFASGSLRTSVVLNGVALGLSLAKAWALGRACGHKISPWLAGWVAGALGFIHLFPVMIAVPAARPGQLATLLAGVAVASVLAVPLARFRPLGPVAIGAMAVHAWAAAFIHQLPPGSELFVPPLLAAACILPWPAFGWAPLAAAVLLTPFRTRAESFLSTKAGLGAALVTAAFALLGVGFLKSLRGRSAPAPAATAVPRAAGYRS